MFSISSLFTLILGKAVFFIKAFILMGIGFLGYFLKQIINFLKVWPLEILGDTKKSIYSLLLILIAFVISNVLIFFISKNKK